MLDNMILLDQDFAGKRRARSQFYKNIINLKKYYISHKFRTPLGNVNCFSSKNKLTR